MRLPFAFAMTAMLASPAVKAEVPVSSLPEIYASYNDCQQVAAPGGLRQDLLSSLGWKRAVVSQNGKPVPKQPLLFGNVRRSPVILLNQESGRGMCVVMARIADAAAFDKFLVGWGGKLPPAKDGVISFKDNGRIVQIRRTGNAQKPSLTVAVRTPLESL